MKLNPNAVAIACHFCTLPNFVLAFVVILFVISASCYIWSSYKHLRAFDGPRIAAFTNLWIFSKLIGGQQGRDFLKVSRKYGMQNVRVSKIPPMAHMLLKVTSYELVPIGL